MEELWKAVVALVAISANVVAVVYLARSASRPIRPRASALARRLPGAGAVQRLGTRAGIAVANAPGAATIRGWPRLYRLVSFLVLLGLVVAVALVLFASFGTGDTFLARLNSAYELVWSNTAGKPYTFIMRDNTWLFPLFAVPGIVLTAYRLPQRIWARASLVWVVFGLGFLAGHVYWGG